MEILLILWFNLKNIEYEEGRDKYGKRCNDGGIL